MIKSTLGMSNAVVEPGGHSAASSYLAYAPPQSSVINKMGANFSAMIASSLNIFAFFGIIYALAGLLYLDKGERPSWFA